MGAIIIIIIWLICLVSTYPNTKLATWGSTKFGDYRSWVLFLLCLAIIMSLIILTVLIILVGEQ